jgi:hypothetical protein
MLTTIYQSARSVSAFPTTVNQAWLVHKQGKTSRHVFCLAVLVIGALQQATHPHQPHRCLTTARYAGHYSSGIIFFISDGKTRRGHVSVKYQLSDDMRDHRRRAFRPRRGGKNNSLMYKTHWGILLDSN